ncbi:MAG: serine/threonine-protein kinase [Sandaracinaceae bacterium]
MDDLSGHVIDGYSLVRRLGEGGAGSVYRAQTPSGAHVAFKMFDPEIAKHPTMRERFDREARALNGLDHPHLIKLLDYGLYEGTPYLVMELLEGIPLDRLLEQREIDPMAAVDLGVGIVAGLAHAHAHGVLHRDLKPANVFIAVLRGGILHPKLLDFGLARFTDRERWGSHATLTEEGTVIGTPTYMAPEQGFGGATDEKSDVYSAGVVLYELLTRRVPFERESRSALVRAHALEPFPDPRVTRPGLAVCEELLTVLDVALAKRGRERYPDAVALLRALQDLPTPAAWLE